MAGHEQGHGRDRLRSTPADDEDRPAHRRCSEIRQRRRQPPGRRDPARPWIDRDDPVRRRADDRPAAADHVDVAVERGGRRMRRRLGQRAEALDPAASGIEPEHRRRCSSRRRRAARDDDLAVGRRDGCVAKRRRKVADDAGNGPWPPGDDRVEPPCPGEAADDVRRVSEHRSGLIRARCRQMCHRHRAAGCKALDLVMLRNTVPASEEVDAPAESHGGGVVQRLRQVPDGCRAARPDQGDRRARHVGGRQTARQHDTAAPGRGAGVLDPGWKVGACMCDDRHGHRCPPVRDRGRVRRRA